LHPQPVSSVTLETYTQYTNWKLPTNRARLRWLTRHASIPRGRAVDIGTKDGSAVKVLADMGYQAIGFDPDPRFHAFAKQRYGVTIRPEWFTAEAVGPGSLDLVTAYHVFEHVRQPLPWLSEIWEALQPEGFLQLDTPNLSHIYATQINGNHPVLYTVDTLRQILEKAGFKILAMTECAPGGNRTYDQLGVVAQRDRPKPVHFGLSEVDRLVPRSLERPKPEPPQSRVLRVRIYRGVRRRIACAYRKARYRHFSRIASAHVT
jgi:SAM-dependent methyltransferase